MSAKCQKRTLLPAFHALGLGRLTGTSILSIIPRPIREVS